MTTSEVKRSKLDWLERVPAALAFLSAYALAMAVIFELAWLQAANAIIIFAHFTISDFVDRAIPAVVCTFIYLASAVGGAAVIISNRKQRSRPAPKPSLVSIIALGITSFACLVFSLVAGYLGGWVGSWFSTSIWAAVCGILLGLLTLTMHSDRKGSRHGVTWIIIAVTALPLMATAGFGSNFGAFNVVCPTVATVTLVGGEKIQGDVLESVGRGLLLRVKWPSSIKLIPWSQVGALDEVECRNWKAWWRTQVFPPITNNPLS